MSETKKSRVDAVVSCDCGCCHAVDYGACPEFEKGGNGRCAYCDHAEKCHNHKKPPKQFNRPL